MLDLLFRPLMAKAGSGPLPTTDIYFSAPLQSSQTLCNRIEPLGRTLFGVGNRAVLIRYASREEIALITRRKFEKLYYLIDDDLFAAQNDPFLPADYRKKLTSFANRILPEILNLADEIIAPNPSILDAPAFLSHNKAMLDPAYTSISSDFNHFDSPPVIRCIMLGTRSHRADIASIASELISALSLIPNLIVTTFMGRHAPHEFRKHPQIENRSPLPWPDFRNVLRSERFHIGLAPALPTDFNRARSISRILDHAALGAAGIYTNQLPFSDRLASGKNGLLIDDSPGRWCDALIALATNLKLAKSIAEGGRKLAEQLGDPEHVRQFWNERLLTA